MRNVTREFTLNDSAKVAVKVFRDSKPWKGTAEERLKKFTELHAGLCRAYSMETVLVRDVQSSEPNASSGASHFDPSRNRIVLRGRLSAVTYLFCFALAFGADRDSALAAARKIFKHFFPRSYGGCRDSGGMLLRDQTMRN